MPSRQSRERVLLGTTIRTWHTVSVTCMVAIGVLYVMSTIATSEWDLPHVGVSLLCSAAFLAALWLVSLKIVSRYFILAWPVFLVITLGGAHFVAPSSAQLLLGTLVLAFLLTGLTQPQWLFLALIPPAACAYTLVADLPVHQLVIRLILAISIWTAVAALPGWLTARLRDARIRYATQATTDQLTMLPNRRAWDARLGELLDGDSKHALVVGLADIDHFKRFNDAHGHLEGDVLLADFADALRSNVKEADIVARWGGEEFAFALIGCSREDAVNVAERLRGAMPRGQTCSVGLAAWVPGEDASSITHRADQALYRAKAHGRDRTEID